MTSLRTFIKNNVFLLFSIGILLATSIFVGYKSAKIDLFFSDAISDNLLLEAPFERYDIEIQSIHTHLLKWPVVLVENAFGFTQNTHIAFSILLLIGMNVWLGYLIFRFSKKNRLATAICLLLLASVELLTGISANEGTLSMITIRNIELPLIVTIILLSLRTRKIASALTAIIAFLWAILFVTDQLLFYTTIIGAVLYLIIDSVKNHNYKVSHILNKPLYIGVFAGAVLYKLISLIFEKAGIAHFYTRSSEDLTWVDSFNHLFNNALNYIGKIFDVFGAGFFNQQIFSLPIYLINIALLLTGITLAMHFVKNYRQTEQDNYQKTIVLLLLMYFFAMLIFTVLIPRELGGRYFAFLPIIALLLIAYRLQHIKLTLSARKTIQITCIAIVLISALFLYIASMANDIYYRQKYSSLVERQGNISLIMNTIQDEDIGVYIDQDYWRNIVVKYQTKQTTGISVDSPLVYCGGNVVDKQFSRKSWAIADGSNSAVRVKECDSNAILKSFGKPDRIVKLDKDGSDLLFIYKKDVRTHLDLKEYEPGFIKP